jgi:Cu/Ag efflux protein CusF
MKHLGILVLAALALAACQSAAPPKRYALHGEIKALDAKAKTATIKHDQIGDWMAAMTMEFPVKPDAEFAKLQVGQTIDAIVVVMGDEYYVTEIKVAGT